ncbi:MAG: glycine cleavage system protein GcvH [Planctomycetes bacterium]|nr:glycine cleavage system protein GcvH [Planctomycetota bacterium]
MSQSYLPTHEWARLDGSTVTIGLSAFAAGEVGEVIHVQLPDKGTTLSRSKPCAEIESVKSVNDYYSPVDGEVIEVNEAVKSNPELVNSDPAGKGWFVKVKPSSAKPLDGLMSDADYQKHITK